jgi:hypothetical protein
VNSAFFIAAIFSVQPRPELDDFEPHSNGAPQKATSAPFDHRQFEKDCATLAPELRKLLV